MRFSSTLAALALGLISAGCARQSIPPSLYPESAVSAPSADAGYKLLYSFAGSPDGAVPLAGLFALKGMLYGTTQFGGTYCVNNPFPNGCGTVYEVSPSGKERVLYKFAGPSDGQFPSAGLTAANDLLYGTVEGGGAGWGTVFSVSRFGNERVLYTFKGMPDAGEPTAGLIFSNGSFYGTTGQGGGCRAAIPIYRYRYGCGTVFRVTELGKERVLYAFKGLPDGAYPSAGVVATGGALFGTTSEGGEACLSGTSYGCGIVFELTASGKERVLHTFTGSPDGGGPGALLTLDGMLYGVTGFGGKSACPESDGAPIGCGTVFEIGTSAKERVLYNFKGGADGAGPNGLTIMNGVLYGTTSIGGTGRCYANGELIGCGTVFELNRSGKERVLYSFKNGADGADPVGSLIAMNGALYGVTSYGGAHGYGAIFKMTPAKGT